MHMVNAQCSNGHKALQIMVHMTRIYKEQQAKAFFLVKRENDLQNEYVIHAVSGHRELRLIKIDLNTKFAV